MGNAWEWIKTHPVYVIGGVGALLVVYFILSSRGGTSGQTVVTGSAAPTDAEVQGATAVNLAQLQLAGQGQQLQAQLSATNVQAQTAVTIAGYQADVQKYQTEQAANVQELGITAQRDVQIAGLTTQQTIAQYSADVQTHQADVAAQVDIAKSLALSNIFASQADVQKTQIETQGNLAMAPYVLATKQLEAITGPGGQNLKDALYRSQSVVGSGLSIGGIIAQRGGTPTSGVDVAGIARSVLDPAGANWGNNQGVGQGLGQAVGTFGAMLALA